MEGMIIRPATVHDFSDLVRVEARAWSGQGTAVYTADHFAAWLTTCPELFWVGVLDNVCVGYVYGQRREFKLEDAHVYNDCDKVTDHGYSSLTHQPSGNALYGMCVASIVSGAGVPLIRHLHEQTRVIGCDTYFSFPRIAGFAEYVAGLDKQGVLHSQDHEMLNELAIWYCRRSIELRGLTVWNSFPPAQSRWPDPVKPDGILTWHMHHWTDPSNPIGALRLVPNFMPDRRSLGYSVMICTQTGSLRPTTPD